MIKRSFITSQLSFFNVAGLNNKKKKKRDKVKEALHTGVKAFMTLTPKLFPQDSQHSLTSEPSPSPRQHSTASASAPSDSDQRDRSSSLSKKGSGKRTLKLKKMFGLFAGSPPSDDVPRRTPVGKGSFSEESQFKWGKERKIMRSDSPVELFDSHLAQDTDDSKDDMSATVRNSSFDETLEPLNNDDDLPVSDSDSDSDGEIEMIWGAEKADDKNNEPGEPFQSLLQELKAQVYHLHRSSIALSL
jgi:hypothetical protein